MRIAAFLLVACMALAAASPLKELQLGGTCQQYGCSNQWYPQRDCQCNANCAQYGNW